jgi:thiol-disulfide isomerase/thioredoxin
MKKLILLISVICFYQAAFAQYDTTPPYLKTKLLPAFNLVALDSATVFNQSVVATDKSTIVMLFNPTCGHCQDQLKLLLSMDEVAKNTNLILASTETLEKIKLFAEQFQLSKYPWVHIGKDTKYFFGSFYQPKTIPVLAFYNKKQQLVYFNQGNVKKKDIIAALK